MMPIIESSPSSASPQAQGEGPPDRPCHNSTDPAATLSPLATSRAEAIASGQNRYFTGAACCRGHVCERLSSNGNCVECSQGRSGHRPKRSARPPWEPKQTARLLELHAKKFSGGRIAAELGITRNAVIGRLDRLGLRLLSKPMQKRAVPKPKPKAVHKPKPKADHPWRPSHVQTRPDGVQAQLAAAAPTVVEQNPATACTLLELTARSCRWPLGEMLDPPRLFCGGEALEDLPYCGRHSRLAYAPRRR